MNTAFFFLATFPSVVNPSKENVDTFVSFVEMLLDLKTTGTSNQDLLGTLVRHLSKPSEGRQEGNLHAPLFKGMVLATRIAATIFKTPAAKPEALVSGKSCLLVLYVVSQTLHYCRDG